MPNFAGRVALVTGGARGQGRSHAVNLARLGADVAILDICEQIPEVQYPMSTDEDMEETVRLIEKEDRRALPIKADVRDYEAVVAAVERVTGEFGRLDHVVANAGIMTSFGDTSLDISSWQPTIDTMLSGVFYTLRESVKPMIASGRGGSIVITGSTSSYEAVAYNERMLNPGQIGYGAAKHGVLAIMKNFAMALGKHKIRVNLVAPSGVNTVMVVNEFFGKVKEDAPPGWQQNALGTSLAEPQDISEAVLFLLSDEARYVTGTTIAVDSGRLIM